MLGAQVVRPGGRSAYQALDAASVIPYLQGLDVIKQQLGGEPGQWHARECGDGNLNLVFVVQGPLGAVVVKQALPYVRMVGESWPLSLRRNFFEHSALADQARWAAEFVPDVYHVDDAMALTIMEFLTPHLVLRAALINGRRFTRVGEHLGLFLARTLFNSSDLAMTGSEKKRRMATYLSNTAMCEISENLIFDEPYFGAPMNRHTAPQLDLLAAELTQDTDLKIAVQDMKWRFVNHPECLVHGDLHTGSIMVTADETRVIDPEFACYGPMAFDVGVLLGNFLLAYFSQPGHAADAGQRDAFGSYLLEQSTRLWDTFTGEFSRLWRDRGLQAGCYAGRLEVDSPGFSVRALTRRLQQIWHAALGFAGCEMIRRIVGLAHVADFERIADPDSRAACERRAVAFGRRLLVQRDAFGCVAQLTESASVAPC